MTSSTSPRDLADVPVLDRAAQDLLFRDARTANKFSDEPVTDDQLAALYDLVKWGPTLMNAQPLRLVVVQSDEARARLVPHLAEGNRAKTASAPVVIVLAADTNFHDKLPEVFPHAPQARDRFVDDDERRARIALDNAWLQAGYVILGIRALGLAAGPMAGFDAAALDADLLAGTGLRSFLVVNVGHPAAEGAWFGRLPRLDRDDAVLTL